MPAGTPGLGGLEHNESASKLAAAEIKKMTSLLHSSSSALLVASACFCVLPHGVLGLLAAIRIRTQYHAMTNDQVGRVRWYSLGSALLAALIAIAAVVAGATLLATCPTEASQGCRRHLVVGPYTPYSEPYSEGDIRLVTGYRASRGSFDSRDNVGRIEVFIAGNWSSVCHRGFTMHDAQVTCRQMGFGAVTGTNNLHLHGTTWGEGSGPIRLGNIRCHGDEQRLIDCPRGTASGCSHIEDSGVTCSGGVGTGGEPFPPVPPRPPPSPPRMPPPAPSPFLPSPSPPPPVPALPTVDLPGPSSPPPQSTSVQTTTVVEGESQALCDGSAAASCSDERIAVAIVLFCYGGLLSCVLMVTALRVWIRASRLHETLENHARRGMPMSAGISTKVVEIVMKE